MIFYNAFYVHPILLPSFELNWLIIHLHIFTKRSISAEIPGIYSILSLLCKDEEGTCQLKATLRHLEIETVGSFSKNGEETWQVKRHVGRVKIKRCSTENNVWQALVSMICGLKAKFVYDTKTINRILPMSLSSFILLRPVKIKHWNPSVAPCGLKFPKKKRRTKITTVVASSLGFGPVQRRSFPPAPSIWINEKWNLCRFFRESFPKK